MLAQKWRPSTKSFGILDGGEEVLATIILKINVVLLSQEFGLSLNSTEAHLNLIYFPFTAASMCRSLTDTKWRISGNCKAPLPCDKPRSNRSNDGPKWNAVEFHLAVATDPRLDTCQRIRKAHSVSSGSLRLSIWYIDIPSDEMWCLATKTDFAAYWHS